MGPPPDLQKAFREKAPLIYKQTDPGGAPPSHLSPLLRSAPPRFKTLLSAARKDRREAFFREKSGHPKKKIKLRDEI